jgi:hypothetical protein
VENNIPFTDEHSIVRKIWGNADTVLFIFAGAAAEFALNKAVDWLYFTGKLPTDPIGRLFSTVTYSHVIIFSNIDKANQAIDNITSIHKTVERNRNASIPDWAYRDVLYMLIHYSIASYELLNRKLTPQEKEEVFNVFCRVGTRMHLKDLPTNYNEWKRSYAEHLQNDLERSRLTDDLFKQYKKHLGDFRYAILVEAQKSLVPARVKELMQFSKISFMPFIIPPYKFFRLIKLDNLIKLLILPAKYKAQIEALDVA